MSTERKKVHRTRNNKITVYLSDAELERINAKVDKTLLNREQFVRKMLDEQTIVEAPPAPLWQTVCMMQQAADDMRCIADRVVLTGILDEEHLNNVVQKVETCVEEVTALCFPEDERNQVIIPRNRRSEWER